MESQKALIFNTIQKKNKRVCEFCENNIQNKAKSILRSKPIHAITFNNVMCNTGYLHISSLTCSEHGHHQNYKIDLKLHLAMASVKSLYLVKNKLECMDNAKNYSKIKCKTIVH